MDWTDGLDYAMTFTRFTCIGYHLVGPENKIIARKKSLVCI